MSAGALCFGWRGEVEVVDPDLDLATRDIAAEAGEIADFDRGRRAEPMQALGDADGAVLIVGVKEPDLVAHRSFGHLFAAMLGWEKLHWHWG